MYDRHSMIELNKVKREIKMHGKQYYVQRNLVDDYGEPTGNVEGIKEIRGLFHTERGYSNKTISDGTVVRFKGQPKLLMSYEDAEGIIQGDYIWINNSKYYFNDLQNIQEYNIIVDASLEVELNGSN